MGLGIGAISFAPSQLLCRGRAPLPSDDILGSPGSLLFLRPPLRGFPLAAPALSTCQRDLGAASFCGADQKSGRPSPRGQKPRPPPPTDDSKHLERREEKTPEPKRLCLGCGMLGD